MTRGGAQSIPRPAGARPGLPAVWSRLPPEARRPVPLARVRRAMLATGPMVPFPEALGETQAAVLVAVFEEAGEARVILTRRSTALRSHTGEVSFPGGRLDPGETPVAAALRESAEEVGLDPRLVEILGQLPPLATMSGRAGITPFVGAIDGGRPALSPNDAEVDRLFDVELAELLDDGVHREERWDISGGLDDRPIHFFEVDQDTVWGATARILHELLELVALTDPA